MAETFIKKVLLYRQKEFDGAWDKFSRTVTSHGLRTGGSEEKQQRDSTVPADVNNTLSAVRTNLKKSKKTATNASRLKPIKREDTLTRTSSLMSVKSHAQKSMETIVQGPLLRRAVSATVQDAVEDELAARKNNVSRSVLLIDELTSAYGELSPSPRIKAANFTDGNKEIPSSSQRTKNRAGVFENGMNGSSPVKTGKVQATSTDWVTLAAVVNKSSSIKVSPGESLLVDIPLGMDDTLERLLRAGAIRCYVPAFFPDHDPSSAYQMYLKLPPGLSKVRYEQEAWRWCQSAVNELRLRGLMHIKDVMPFSKFNMFLKGAQTPAILIETCKDIIHALMKMGSAPRGFEHKASINQLAKRSTVDIMTEDVQKEIGIESFTGIENFTGTTNEMSKSASDLTAEEAKASNLNVMTEKNRVDPTLPGRMLEMCVETGSWSKMKSSVEDILLHAAFLICPNALQNSTDDSEDPLATREMGHASFKAYIRTLQRAESDKERRELTRSRFRAALILATPYSLRLQADGTYTVADLITTNLPSLRMPPIYQAQVEALLTVSVAQATKSKAAKTTKDYAINDKNEFEVPMLYDPKFQRGPFDPYGRAPRLSGLAKLFKKKKFIKKYVPKNDDDDTSEASGLPKGILEMRDIKEVKDVNKFWNFHANEASNDECDETTNNEMITWGGTGTTDYATKRYPGVVVNPSSPLSSVEMDGYLTIPDGETTIASTNRAERIPATSRKPTRKQTKPDFEAHVRGELMARIMTFIL